MRFRLTAGTLAPNLKSVTIVLPAGLSFARGHAALAAGIASPAANRRSLVLVHGRLTITLKHTRHQVLIALRIPALAEGSGLQRRVKALLAYNRDKHHRHKRTMVLKGTVTLVTAAHKTARVALTLTVR